MNPRAAELTMGLIDHALDAAGGCVPHAAVSYLRAHLPADRVALYLIDRRRERLHRAAESPSNDAAPSDPAAPLAAGPAESPTAASLPANGSAAGQALATETVTTTWRGHHTHLQVPVCAYGAAIGVLTFAFAGVTDETPGGLSFDEWQRLGRTLAVLLHQAASTTDDLELIRRSSDYSIAAELQWQLLPPTQVAADQFALHALVEPAPRVTSDLFDWSLNGSVLTLTLLDAAGRGLAATQTADLALAALRNARRRGNDLADQAALADQVLWDRHHGHATVHALLVEIDLEAATAHAVHAGSPYVLRRRRQQVTRLAFAEHDPLGLLDRTHYRAHPIDIAPKDTVLLLSDGAPTAADPHGTPYGLEYIAERLRHSTRPRDLPPSLITDLRAHTRGDLADDATAMVLEWHG